MELFFFFKQKTAYEMHISDWSSDVCSSDLGVSTDRQLLFDRADPVAESPEFAAGWGDLDVQSAVVSNLVRLVLWLECSKPSLGQRHVRAFSRCRSEEHTSELQSLMRISYAVFCLKKKTQQYPKRQTTN